MAVIALTNGNYTVRYVGLDNGATANVGAVTFCNGTTGCSGTVSAANSLIGSTAADGVGIVTPLTNSNYLVTTLNWDNGATTNVGAATSCSGTTGCTGAVTAANSLIGSTAADAVGSQITTLTNGNYVVRSPSWDNGAVADTGAVTWGNGAAGITAYFQSQTHSSAQRHRIMSERQLTYKTDIMSFAVRIGTMAR